MNENEQKIELTLNLVNGILSYLGTRPYQEVFLIIKELEKQAAVSFEAQKKEKLPEE